MERENKERGRETIRKETRNVKQYKQKNCKKKKMFQEPIFFHPFF